MHPRSDFTAKVAHKSAGDARNVELLSVIALLITGQGASAGWNRTCRAEYAREVALEQPRKRRPGN
jgi:hypothetical protein